ncbi:signal peptidase I [Arthrobacter monumenti]
MTVPAQNRETGPRQFFSKDGWVWFLLTAAAQVYLIFVLALTVIATVPMILGWQGSVVQSGSMEPKIRPGDVVLSTELPDESPVPVGGVVEFQRPQSDGSGFTTILHRIVHDNEDGTYVTAGDANPEVDSTPITRERITAQARLLIPFIGLPSLWIGSANYPPLAVWSVVTLLAIAAAAFGLGPLKRSGHDDENPGDDPGSPEHSPAEGQPADAGRRTILALAIASVAAGLTALPRGATTAAFTARTSNVKNSWSVAAAPPLLLGRLTPYALFAAASITNDGPTTFIDGSAGTSPGTTITGFNFWQISGGVDRNNQVARNAKTDAAALYAAVDARQSTRTLKPTLTGTIAPGIYGSSTGDFIINGTLTLDGQGNADAVFIFTGTTITAARDSHIKLVNGASAHNIFWRATGTINLIRDSVTSGNFLATNAAAIDRQTDLTGRLISLNGSITVNRATIRVPR